MVMQTVRTVRLLGDESIRFANSMFRPTQEEMARSREYLGDISENISIRRNNDGFEADITDLDLSFLDVEPKEIKINVMISFENNISSSGHYNTFNKDSEYSTVIMKRKTHYNTENNKNISWVA